MIILKAEREVIFNPTMANSTIPPTLNIDFPLPAGYATATGADQFLSFLGSEKRRLSTVVQTEKLHLQLRRLGKIGEKLLVRNCNFPRIAWCILQEKTKTEEEEEAGNPSLESKEYAIRGGAP